jgi:hypothetical protein
MKDTFKVYNNEAFICPVVCKILGKEEVDIGRLFLLVALFLNDKMLNDKSLNRFSSLQEYVNSNTRKFVSFSKFYEELLPLILNALTLLCESDIIALNGQIIKLQISDCFAKVDGDRLQRIQSNFDPIWYLISDLNDSQLYNILSIKL